MRRLDGRFTGFGCYFWASGTRFEGRFRLDCPQGVSVPWSKLLIKGMRTPCVRERRERREGESIIRNYSTKSHNEIQGMMMHMTRSFIYPSPCNEHACSEGGLLREPHGEVRQVDYDGNTPIMDCPRIVALRSPVGLPKERERERERERESFF